MDNAPLILLAAGGTGGHLFPAEALGVELIKRGLRVRLATDARVSFSISNPFRWAASRWDPETDLSTAADQGAAAVGGYNYATDSAPRTYLLTLRFGF